LEFVFFILYGMAILFGVVLFAIGLYLILPIPYLFPTESDYTYHRAPWWQLYYCHKYLHPRQRAAKGSGLEAYFRELDFHFDEPNLEERRRFTIAAVGDIMCRKELVGSRGASLFDDIGETLFSAELTIGNLEFPVNPHEFHYKLIRFSVSGSFAMPLLTSRYGRFDAVSLANNHINDSLHQGITETCRFLDDVGIRHAGANPTPEAQDDILIFEQSGAKIAMLSYTFSTNGIPLEKGKQWGTNVIRFNALEEDDYSPELILKHIAMAKKAGADYIVSSHHWGIDHEIYPPSRMIRRAHALLDAGIDLIIGHHPHVLGPIDRYRTKDGRDGLIFFSLGNITAKALFLPIQRLAAVARIELTSGIDEQGARKVVPARIEMVPTLFTLLRSNGKKQVIIRRIKPAVSKIAEKDGATTLTFKEKQALKSADRLYRKHFEHEGDGIIHC
jgi:hypothetical protein